LPLIKTCIEVHGEQHFKYVPFYHSSIFAFIKAKKRDEDKKSWCELNNIKYIAFSYDEDLEEWKNKLREKPHE
jgi:predicted adenine nucleotide alpha hydrolase (AANH) superfamily ATPase